MKGEVNTIIR